MGAHFAAHILKLEQDTAVEGKVVVHIHKWIPRGEGGNGMNGEIKTHVHTAMCKVVNC